MDNSTSVLIVEDNAIHMETIRRMLDKSTGERFTVESVSTLRDAIALLHDNDYDVVLLDLGLPDNQGPEGVARLKASAPKTPVVVLTANHDDDSAIQSIQFGAQEFLAKKHLDGELLIRVIRHSIVRQQQLLEAEAKSLVDVLTDLGNRRAFELELRRRVAETHRHGTPFSVALIDLDHFKNVNDSYGHEAGDTVLREVASVLSKCTRQTDLVTRIGGEEFAILFPSTSLAGAGMAMESLREAIASTDCDQVGPTNRTGPPTSSREAIALTDCGGPGQPLAVTCSAGVASAMRHEDGSELVRRADEALYRAKQAGRNRCYWHDGTAIEPVPTSAQPRHRSKKGAPETAS